MAVGPATAACGSTSGVARRPHPRRRRHPGQRVAPSAPPYGPGAAGLGVLQPCCRSAGVMGSVGSGSCVQCFCASALLVVWERRLMALWPAEWTMAYHPLCISCRGSARVQACMLCELQCL
eukprot:1451240-Lingulodinium_polyedra.AAC.1